MTSRTDAARIVAELQAAGYDVREAFILCELSWYGAAPPAWSDLRAALIDQLTRDEPDLAGLDPIEARQ